MPELAAAGARRLSVGGALALAAVAPLLRAGREMREQGSFGWVSEASAWSDIRAWLK